jgi:magnesium transporter
MIRALLHSADGQYIEGDERLIDRWRELPEAHLWLDIQDEITPQNRQILSSLGCNELAIKDCARTRHPPKVEDFQSNCFILFRGISALDDSLTLVPQQLGIWVGSNYLITVHRGNSVSIDHFLEIAAEENLVKSPNILTLRLLHYAAGRYLEKLMAAEEKIAGLEEQLLEGEAEAALKDLVSYRGKLRSLRRTFNYHQSIADTILNEGNAHLGSGNDDSYHMRRDLYDRCERLQSLCALYYELCGDLIDGYISLSSHQLNNTMKVLTIITAIFVPITFIAGIYGMNFDNMPELRSEHGYFFALGAIVLIATSMVLLFKKIRWL